MDRLYPEVATGTDAKYGRTFPDNYTPKPLDSEADARGRLIAALRAGDDDASAISKALAGSDEVPTVKRMLAELMAEKAALQAVPQDAADYAAQVTAKAVLLDAAEWVAKTTAVATATPVVVEEPQVLEK